MTIQKRKKAFGRTQIEGYLWLLPFMAFYAVFTLWMLFRTGVLSFQDYNLMRGGTFNGLDNYEFLFTDPAFWSTLKNTSLFVLFSTPLLIIVPLIIAVLIEHRMLVGKDFFRFFVVRNTEQQCKTRAKTLLMVAAAEGIAQIGVILLFLRPEMCVDGVPEASGLFGIGAAR